MSGKSFIKNQSAMEYLMTYGWSILIVAVVLGALSFLGVFNPLTFAPKARPGSCQIIENSEFGSSNLVGTCNNQVPQYVAQFDNQIGINSGESTSNITANSNFNDPNNPAFTITLWYKIQNPQVGTQYIDNMVSIPGYTGLEFLSIGNNQAQVFLHRCYTDVAGIQEPFSTFFDNQWNFIGVSYNPADNKYFFQFNSNNSTVIDSGSFGMTQGSIIIGGPGGCVYDEPFNGELSNVQVYNTALGSNSINAIYDEGIGGAPVDLKNISDWWPLNGNANDYSGNQNNGIPKNVIFTSNWYDGYRIS